MGLEKYDPSITWVQVTRAHTLVSDGLAVPGLICCNNVAPDAPSNGNHDGRYHGQYGEDDVKHQRSNHLRKGLHPSTNSPEIPDEMNAGWCRVLKTFLGGGVPPGPETLTLFQTKIYDFPYPISDLTLKIYTLFQTLWSVAWISATLNRTFLRRKGLRDAPKRCA